MGFFDEFPSPPAIPEFERPEPKPWEGPPRGSIGGWVPWRVLLLHTDDAHFVLRDFEAFPTGLKFSLVLYARPETFEIHPRPGRPGARGPRFGVAFADGRKTAVSLGHPPYLADHEGGQIVLHSRGGGGNNEEYHMRFWLWPLPPPGPLTVVAEWPEQGVAERSHELDGTQLESAAAEAQQLWS